jgi:hypothetical protein
MIKRNFNLSNCHIALFSPTLFLSGGSFKTFRATYLNEFMFDNGVQFKASHFADCSDSWGISFGLWHNGETKNKNNFNYTLVDENNGKIVECGNKIVYNIDGEISASDWVKELVRSIKSEDSPQLSSAIKVKEKGCGKLIKDALGYYVNVSNNVYKNQTDVYIVSSCSSMGHGCSILPENFDRVCANYASRILIKKDWQNWADEYLAPNEEHEKYQEFVRDSVIYSLFESKSNQSSLRQIEYKGKLWDIKNELFWMGKEEIMDLANKYNMDEIYEDAKTSEERYVYNYIQEHKEEFSQEALNVLNKAIELTKKSFKYRQLFADEHPEYQLEKCWDAGFYQLKAIWKEYMKDDFEEFKKSYKVLSDKMRPMVYELGFLK